MNKRHPNLIKIGKLILEARTQKGFSQEAFAAEAGLGHTYIIIKRGKLVATFSKDKRKPVLKESHY